MDTTAGWLGECRKAEESDGRRGYRGEGDCR
jgi:hypothetical protein